MRSPESVGISSAAIARLIRSLNEQGVPLHSLLIARRGQVVYEGYWAPYTRDTLHRMYSQTKSLTALAIGLLEADGKLSVKDHVCDCFPEYVTDRTHPWTRECTIEDLLTMRTCYDGTVYTKEDRTLNWEKQFFEAVPTHRPGTVFAYDTTGTQVLGALAEKLSGQPMLDFLKDRLLRRIGFSEESYIIPVGPLHTAMAGSGLMAKPMDMMRVALLFMNGGKDPAKYGDPNAEQLFPAEYLSRMLGFQTSTRPIPLGADFGYGYYIWLMRDGYRMYGMASELSMCFPAEDIAVITTADTQVMRGGEERIEELVREFIVRDAADARPEDAAAQADLAALTETLAIPTVPNPFAGTAAAARVNGAVYDLEENPQGFESIRLTFAGDGGELTVTRKGNTVTIPFGIGHQAESVFAELQEMCLASGGWIEENTFLVQVYFPGEALSGLWFKMNLRPDGWLTAQLLGTTEGMLEHYNTQLNGKKRR